MLYFEFHSFGYSEPTSIHSLGGRWEDDIGSGDTALTVDRAYLGAAYGPFRVEYIRRYDAYYDFDPDTARLIYQVENKLPLRPGERYDLYLDSYKTDSRGFRLGYSDWISDKVRFSFYTSLLQLSDLEHGEIEGSARVVDENDYDFSFESDVVYEKDPLYGREAGQVSGRGYSFDMALHYLLNEQWDIALEVLDLHSKMKVDDAPFTTATASSDTKTFDEDGYVVYDPVVTGFEGNRDYSFEFNTQAHLALGYRLTGVDSFHLQHHHYSNLDYQELNYSRRFDALEFSLNLVPGLDAYGFSLRNEYFEFRLTTDDLDYEKAHFLDLSLQLYLPLD